MLMVTSCDDPSPAEPRAKSFAVPVETAASMGHRLEDMTWLQAKDVLTPDAVVVIPVGAASKEHGPHLRLNNDKLMADYFASEVLQRADVVVAPTVGFHHYPAFVEYAGSVSLRLETARDLIVDIITSLAAHGPRRFYVLNTGVSTVRALEPAAAKLRDIGVLMTFTDLKKTRAVVAAVSEQAGGTHADEIETSMMLVIAPDTVDMSKAVDDYDDSGRPGLSPRPDAGLTYSPSGVWGDATLATREKGKVVVEARIKQMLDAIGTLRTADLPAKRD